MSYLVYLAGSEEEMCSQLISLGIKDEYFAKKVFAFIDENKDYIFGLENYTVVKGWGENHAGRQANFPQNTDYRMSIQITTIAIITIILNSPVTKELASAVLRLYGGYDKYIVGLSEYNGEVCIAKETFLQARRIEQKNALADFKGKCHNCDLNCRYRKLDRCMCDENSVAEISIELSKRGLFVKQGSIFMYRI